MLSYYESFFLVYFLAVNLVYAVLTFFGIQRVFFRRKEMKVEDYSHIVSSSALPEICFIIPMYNEGKNILALVENIGHLSYRYKRIIITNDGSQDNSMEILKEKLQLISVPKFYDEILPTQRVIGIYRSKIRPEILVLDKEHGLKSDAVNASLNACQNPFFLVADADSFIDDEMFNRMIRPILATPNAAGIGAGVRVRNGCSFGYKSIDASNFPRRFLPAVQNIEYLRSFLMRQGWNDTGGNFVVAGAFSVFQTKLIREIGGFYPCAGEDAEVIVRLHRILNDCKIPYKILYFPDPTSWTEAPDTLQKLGKQRTRWHLAILETLWFHKRMFLNPKYSLFGVFAFPFFLWGEALEPIVEILGIIYIFYTLFLGTLNIPFILLFLSISLGFMMFLSAACLVVEQITFGKYTSLRGLIGMFGASIVENIGYRQFSLFWRVRAFFHFMKNFSRIRKDTKKIDELVKTAREELPKFSSHGKEGYF